MAVFSAAALPQESTAIAGVFATTLETESEIE
jgi:hypothetical protein